MYHVSSRGWSEIKGFEVVACVVVRDEGCEVKIVVYIEYSDRVK